MPKEIIDNATKILSKYEQNSKNEVKTYNEQLEFNFNEEKSSKVEEKLDEIDILKITPIEAMNLLYELKELNKK